MRGARRLHPFADGYPPAHTSGHGYCQGTFCSLRAVAALSEHDIPLEFSATDNVRRFLQERWGGLRPALWGMQAREMELGRAVYAGTLNLDGAAHEQDC
jgi:hypothetical protein